MSLWPLAWRRTWGRLANRLEDRGARWDEAEWRAFLATAVALARAEDAGEVPEWSYPDRAHPEGLADAEAVAAIEGAFATHARRDGRWVRSP